MSQPTIVLLGLLLIAAIRIRAVDGSLAQSRQGNDDDRSWRWIPEEKHPCSIPRLTRNDVFQKFGPQGVPPLYHSPIVILGTPESLEENRLFYELTEKDALLEFFGPEFNVTLSSSNSLSEHLRTIPLSQYLEEAVEKAGETLPDQGSNETWYLFGRTYSERWEELLKHYKLPPCRTCKPDLVALSFGVGNRGSGVQWHVHGPGFSEALHGRKHWVLYPPDQPPAYHKDQSSRQWMEVAYWDAKQRPHECTLDEGDMIYFPDRWFHCTLNLDRYTAFVSTFTTEHDLPFYDEL